VFRPPDLVSIACSQRAVLILSFSFLSGLSVFFTETKIVISTRKSNFLYICFEIELYYNDGAKIMKKKIVNSPDKAASFWG
jgi:hypothetical protein